MTLNKGFPWQRVQEVRVQRKVIDPGSLKKDT